MWSSEEAIQRRIVELGVPRGMRRREGQRRIVYERNTPPWARGWIDTIAADCDPAISHYVSACIVAEKRGDNEPNLRQRIYSRGARGIEYGNSFLAALTIVQRIQEILYRPAMVMLGRRLAAAPKRVLPVEHAVEHMLDEARETVSTLTAPQSADQLIRALAAYRRGESSGTSLERIVSDTASGKAYRNATAAMGFGIAHELAHHLLDHGVAARQGSDNHPPGRRLLTEWRRGIGFEQDTRHSRPHQRELDADAFAVLLLSGQRTDGATGLLSAGMASHCVLTLSLMEDQDARSLDVPSRSHPTFRTRMINLLEHNYLAFDEYREPLDSIVDLGRPARRHPSSFMLQNVYMAQVTGLLIDLATPRLAGASFGLRRW
ncbi:hypothetical protein ACH0CG_00705 [Microbacterium sp. 179-I 1D1 NHS]|uniref:hypothetical protein n=1 Tax=Microbacterium sp. 179-I 1D1 NHS TaxID=3374298 RepID=UPI00387940B0